MNGFPGWYLASMGFLFGAAIASFLGVVVERLPKGIGIGGRSHCACGRQLRATENIPVVGWLRCGGRARCCQARIPGWYVLSEVLAGVVFAVAAIWFGLVGLLVVAAITLVAGFGVAVVRRTLNPRR